MAAKVVRAGGDSGPFCVWGTSFRRWLLQAGERRDARDLVCKFTVRPVDL